MIKFKETPAFEDLQRIVGNDIAGIYLARLKEYGVHEEKLLKVAEEICYDVASALTNLQDFEIPAEEPSRVTEEAKSDDTLVSEPAAADRILSEEKTADSEPGDTSEEKTDDFSLDLCSDDLDFLEEKTDDIEASDTAASEEKTDDFQLDLSIDDLDFLEEKTDPLVALNTNQGNETSHRPVKGVLSQAEILKILDAAQQVTPH